MPELPCPTVAVSGGACSGVGESSGGDYEFARNEFTPGG